MSSGARGPSRGASLAFALGHLATAGVVGAGVFGGLPTRWAPVDMPAAALVVLHAAASVSLVRGRPVVLARVAAWASLAVGLALIAILAWTATYLSTIYGPVGKGGALIMALVIALALPYLVALPAGELVWLGPARKRTTKES